MFGSYSSLSRILQGKETIFVIPWAVFKVVSTDAEGRECKNIDEVITPIQYVFRPGERQETVFMVSMIQIIYLLN